MDFPAFASLAQVHILLVPVGSIRRETFDTWAAEIRTFENLRLGDIPADTREDRARFMPNPLSRGHLHLSFPSHPPSPSHHPLALFRPSSFPLGVIGVAACSQSDSLSSILAEFNASVNEMFPLSSPYRPIFPLASNCFVFEDGDGNTNLNLGEQLSGLVVIPSMMGNKKLYIGTLLADLCSSILGSFSSLVQTLESPVGNEYLNATLFPIVPSIAELPVSLSDGPNTRNTLPPLPSHNSQPEVGTLAGLRNSGNIKRAPSSGPGSPRAGVRQSTLGPPAASKKRQTMIGAASSHGRLFKTLADFFLLAGRTEDALVWYTEAMVVCKSSQDAVWHASALEGAAVVAVLDAWSSGHGLNSSFSSSRGPWADIAEKLTQVSALYAKAPGNVDPTDGNHPLIAQLYTSSVLRHATLLFATWSAKGWGPLAFTTMLQPGPKPVLPPTLSGSNGLSDVNLERLSMITNISRAQIAAVIAEAHGPWLLHLGVRERIAALETVAGLYACLGYKRKEAYVLREVLGCVMDLVVIGREDLGERRSISSPLAGAGLGIQNVDLNGSGSLGVRENERTEGNDAILRIVKYVCSVHGIDTEAVQLVNMGGSPSETERDEEEVGSTDGVPQEPFGWPELQVGIVREALAIAEALPDYPHVAQFCLSALKVLYPVLTAADQQHLYSTSVRALSTARRRGDKRLVDYWSGQPIISIEVTPLPFIRLPIEKPMSSLSLRTSNPILPRATDPFLYNPRRAITAQGQMTVVQNENLEVVITLSNPFVFDLELQSLSLSTSGVPFEHKSISAVVPPNSYHPVTITGKALQPGVLTIRGCIVQAPGGASREFVLPLSTEEEEEKQSRRRSAVQCEAERHKHGGLESRPWKTSKRFSQASSAPSNRRTLRFLECKVVPEQPLLRIRRTSLTHGAVMLYNGETSSIRITLENVSTLPIDFVRLSFDDNTIAPAQQALADGELSVFDTYETEYELIQKPAFSWDARESKEIPPGEKTVLTVTCLGKVGCSSGSIQISYSHVHRRQSTLQQPVDIFHTRHLSYPVLVTVYHMLECHDMDVFEWSSLGRCENTAGSNDDVINTARRQLMNVEETIGWCVFSIDVRNTYGLPFEVTFDRAQEDVPTITSKCIVPPGSTSRILIPLRKFLLSEEHTSQPVPTLSDRQFVVDKTGLTTSEATAQRELFWYREELFKSVKGRWKELGGVRSGELSLRRQRMTMPMLEALRTEAARLHMSIGSHSGATVTAYAPGRYRLAPGEFYFLRVQVSNLSPRLLALTLDLTMEPADHVVYEGTLSDIPVGRLECGESIEVEVSISFVAGGLFELSADARIWGIVGEESKVGHGWLRADVR